MSSPSRSRLLRVLMAANTLLAIAVVVVLVLWLTDQVGDPAPGEGAIPTTSVPAESSTTASSTTSSTTPDPASTVPPSTSTTEPAVWWPADAVGVPQSSTVPGVLTFRGSPNRTYYGEGPIPDDPEVAWTFPESAMCGNSTVGGETTVWCGTGWTGQPAVWERDAETWLAFGAYDRAVHFLDADTGRRRLADFPVGDIIKGSVTVDPDGYPLLYTGSRDDFYRILAFDREGEAAELWRLDGNAIEGRLWNNDWDGAGVVIDDHLFVGGENSIFYIVRLNRAYGTDGLVTVSPELVFTAPGYDDELLAAVGNSVSIENSVAISGDTVYFANGGGLVQGWNISGLAEGTPPTRTFRWWAGDDIDASIVVDEEGMLYVGVEYERRTARSEEVGQILKLDPGRPDDPLVWSIDDRPWSPAGVWSTPAITDDTAYFSTDTGRLLGIDRATGEIRWEKTFPGPVWSSPVVVDEVLVVGDCEGVLHGYDVSDPAVDPPELWAVELGGCIESTPAVWRGSIYVGTRGGFFHALH